MLKKKLKWDDIDSENSMLDVVLTPFSRTTAYINGSVYDINGNCVNYEVTLEFADGSYDDSPNREFKTIEKAKAFAEKKIKQNLLKLKKAIDKYV